MSNFWWNFWRKQLAMGVCAVAGLLSKARRIPFRIQTLILSIHQYPPGCESQQLKMQNGEISGKFGGNSG
ncbi:hypothetical protein KI387_026230, partial [Taxus chinensis]